MDTWIEFMTKPSREVISLFEDEYRKSGDAHKLGNLALALIDAGEWQLAYETCRKCHAETEGSSDYDIMHMGLCQWFLNNTVGAIELWKTAADATYTDVCGPVDSSLLLYYAGCRLRNRSMLQNSLRSMRRFWRIKDYTKVVKWPGTPAIVGYLMGVVPGPVILCQWSEDVPALEYRRQCRVNFWLGLNSLDEDIGSAIHSFKAAFSRSKIGVLHYEYFLAKWEYARLTGENWPAT
jgi:hypothetical protein